MSISPGCFTHCPIDVLKAYTAMGSIFHWLTAVHILTFLQIPHLITGQFKIIPPQNPVIALIGEGVILPCQLRAQDKPQTITVQWILSRNSEKIDVSTYDGEKNEERQDERYQGRTQFFQSEFQAGNVSLNLKNVMVSDKGKYTCSVSFGNWYDEVVVELDVTARGGEPSIFLTDYAGQGIGLTCRSEGWFPEPQVLWLNSKGQNRTEKLTTSNTKTSAGIYNIESSINMEPGSDNEVSCKIINNMLKTASESRVQISDVFFPTTSPWMAAFLVILFLSIALIAAVGYKLKNNNDTTSRSVNQKKAMEAGRYNFDLI
ncbi:butyrophilin subfamily 3 member A2-like [Emydura macquarii macquarii]|uniref:butyrophilin subfamily 3 member A2-like n=1 Tax=Emydura macquarii macquarii TaxID=1129001 RepID=UPI003529EA17